MLIQLHQEFNLHQELLHQLDPLELLEDPPVLVQDQLPSFHLPDQLELVMEDLSEEQASLEDLPLTVMEEVSLELELEDFQDLEAI